MGRLSPYLKSLLGALVTFGLTPAAQAKPPKVVAGDGVLCDLTRTLSGGATDVRCLIAPGTDPHHLQLTPTNRRHLNQANLVLINGYGLTPSFARLQGRFSLVVVGETAVPNNPSGDPHLWHSPVHSSAMAGVVSGALERLPLPAESKVGLKRRLRTAKAIFRDLDAWNRRQFATIPATHRVIVAEHLAFGFLTNRYGLKQLAMIDEHARGGRLRPSSLKAISTAVKASKTRVLFAEQHPPNKTLQRISKISGKPIASKILFADGTAPGQSLIETATANTCVVVNAQGGKCDLTGANDLQRRWSLVQ